MACKQKRNIGALLKRADLAERKGDHDEAEKYLSRYLVFRPDDGETLARYGLTIAKDSPDTNAQAKALMVLERALVRVPDRDDVRRRAAELGRELGRPKEASEQVVALLLKPGLGQLPSQGDRRRLEAQLLAFSQQKVEEGPPAALQQLLTRPDPALRNCLAVASRIKDERADETKPKPITGRPRLATGLPLPMPRTGSKSTGDSALSFENE